MKCLRILFISAVLLAGVRLPAHAEKFQVDPEAGNNTFTAVFDATLGERITAVSSAVQCSITVDDKGTTASGTCAVPLKSIRVDNEDTKTEHFEQWATNKLMGAKDCRFEAKFTGLKLSAPLAPNKPVQFGADVPFTVCGRPRSDKGTEHVYGAAVLFPPGSYGQAKVIRVRAKIDHFNRDNYHIGPEYTEGWLARVQRLSMVVARDGTIELTLFAKANET
jgi:hypothetical protein